ncbi:MAG: alginate lyase family protein [Candidatus Eisenbacteria sp.]|nr:alginate lyase family protein [Candidatus Eisenbacteria bacterium]
MAFSAGCQRADEAPIVVDEPSVSLEAELNLHYKTFSDVTLSRKYMERWLQKYEYLPAAAVMSDEELLEASDLSHRRLETVKAALDEGDNAKARAAWLAYLANRPRPYYLDPGVLSPSGKERILQIANECLEAPNFPDVRWPREKFGRGSKDSRWNWVSSLCQAYRYTKEREYLQGAMEMFSFWYETVRPPAGNARIWLSPSFIDNPWGSHLASGRLHAITVLSDLAGEVAWQESGPSQSMCLYKSIVEHARFLMAVNPGYRSGNIQICQMFNLLEAGIYFPEFKESPEWVAFAWGSLLKHAWLDLMPDGGHYERATGYNNAVIAYWRRIMGLASAAKLEIPDWLRPRLKRAQEWTTKVYTPIYNLPPVGDSGMGSEDSALPYLIDGALLFPCPEFKYFVRNCPDRIEVRATELFRESAPEVLARLDAIQPREPSFTSVLLRDTGWAVMRSGWDRKALYMLFDYGSNEPWHCHRDGLGFSIFAYGEPLITDCGHGGSYESDRSKEWYKETISHNVVQINGMSQRKVTDGTCDRWVTTTMTDYIDAEHDGYKYLGAYCRRKITFVKPSYWIITDNITEKMCQTSGYHECRWLAHFQPTELIIDERTKCVCTNNPGANVLLIPSRPGQIEVLESSGWMITPAGEVEDAPYIAFAKEGDPPIDYEVVVYPYEGAQVPQIAVDCLDMGADALGCKGLRIVSPEGVDYYLEALDADYYFMLDNEGQARRYGEFSFDGEMALLRERNGELRSVLLVGGTILKRQGKVIVQCTGTIDWAQIMLSDGMPSIDGVFSGAISVMPPEASHP